MAGGIPSSIYNFIYTLSTKSTPPIEYNSQMEPKKKIITSLFLGILSITYCEVFSGSTPLWFLSPSGILIIFTLYLTHTLFFLTIALSRQKTTLPQLYFLGFLYSLNEAWVTKVLWSGYVNIPHTLHGSILGIGWSELAIVSFFWHPIMSFILPILTFQILTGQILTAHKPILKRSKSKTLAILILLTISAGYIVNGNNFQISTILTSLGITLLLITAFTRLSKNTKLKTTQLNKTTALLIGAFILLFYLLSLLFTEPQKAPTTLLPYLSIFILYAIGIILFNLTKPTPQKFTPPQKDQYQTKHLLLFYAYLTALSLLLSQFQLIGQLTLGFGYYILMTTGIILFIKNTINVIKQKISSKHHPLTE